MRKLIVRYDSETTAQTVATQDAASVTGVTATLPIDLISAVIVDVKPGQVNAVERRLRQRRSVTRVERPKQAFPHTVDPQYLNDFFARVDRERGYQLPLAGSQTRTQAVARAAETQQVLQRRQQNKLDFEREIASVDDAYSYIGTDVSAVDTSNVIAANLDEGVHPSQFSSQRQMDGFSPTSEGAYDPSGPHGSYTMGVMAGGEQTSGISKAPLSDADIYPIRVNFGGADILACLDDMERLRQSADRPIIFNNSWGYGICDGRCATSVKDAYTALAAKPGIVIVASAGNDAGECGQSCTGTGNNGIASFRTDDNIITVALSGQLGDPRAMVYYSSRGPGSCNDSLEPTTIAPLNGVVPYGSGSEDLGNTVGTSGSAPMVAAVIGQGIAAAGHDVATADIIDAIKTTGTQWKGSGHRICTGWGEIDGQATPQAIAEKPPEEGQSATARIDARTEPPFTPGEDYEFDADASEPVVGGIDTYAWEITNGEVIGKSGGVALISTTDEGTLTVTLTVTDDGGFTATTTNQYQVETPNEPPVASVSAMPLQVTPPGTVTFDATDSSDPDGTIQRFDWEFSDGQTARGIAVQRSVSESNVGTLTGTVTVTDTNGASDSASAVVSVTEGDESKPTARVSVTPDSITPPGTVTFDGSASSDPDGSIQSYEWSFSDGESRFGSVVTRSVDIGDADLRGILRVTDSDGRDDSDSATVTVADVPEGDPPKARISVSKDRVSPPETVRLKGGESTDPDGDIVAYQWVISDIATATGETVDVTIPKRAGDKVPISLTVTNAEGASDMVTTTVAIEGDANSGITDEAIAQGVIVASGVAAAVVLPE